MTTADLTLPESSTTAPLARRAEYALEQRQASLDPKALQLAADVKAIFPLFVKNVAAGGLDHPSFLDAGTVLSNFNIESSMGTDLGKPGASFTGAGQWNRTNPDMRLFFVIDPASKIIAAIQQNEHLWDLEGLRARLSGEIKADLEQGEKKIDSVWKERDQLVDLKKAQDDLKNNKGGDAPTLVARIAALKKELNYSEEEEPIEEKITRANKRQDAAIRMGVQNTKDSQINLAGASDLELIKLGILHDSRFYQNNFTQTILMATGNDVAHRDLSTFEATKTAYNGLSMQDKRAAVYNYHN